MKALAVGISIVILCFVNSEGQTNKTTDHIIEGGKLVVDLIKVLSSKKELESNPGCKGSHADLCVINESMASLKMILINRSTEEQREIVIMPSMKECCFQIAAGIWTYDLHQATSVLSMRKGDLRIEGCQNLIMSIK